MEIRSYRGDDHPKLIALWRGVFGYEEARNDPGFVIRTKLSQGDDLLIVAVDGEEIVGSIMTGFDGHRGWLYRLAVAERARRRGLGAQLVTEAEARLKARGCVKINLQTHVGNRAAVQFWRAVGYAVEDRVSMGKEILSAGPP